MRTSKEMSLLHNQPREIRRELREPRFIPGLVELVGVSPQEAAKLRLSCDQDSLAIELTNDGLAESDLSKMQQAINNYIRWRREGHTAEFVWTVLHDRKKGCQRNTAWATIAEQEQGIPIPYCHLIRVPRDDRTSTLENGETRKGMGYVAMDGAVAVKYSLEVKADGSAVGCQTEFADATEYDPQFKAIIAQVDESVAAEMKRSGTDGQLGSCHVFWQLKKERLRARGIEWKSPAELNPGTCYD